MDPDDVGHLAAHWAESPPAHLAIARVDAVLCALAGVTRPRAPDLDTERRQATPSEIAALVASANGGR